MKNSIKILFLKLRGLLKSKVFWINLLTGTLAFLNSTQFHVLSTVHTLELITGINILLRMITNGSLESKVTTEPPKA
jgi:hypothetical protein